MKQVCRHRTLDQRGNEKPKEIERLNILIDNLPGAVYLCKNDKDFSMIYLNDQVTKLTGYEPRQFISKEINFPDLYFSEDVENVYREVEEEASLLKNRFI